MELVNGAFAQIEDVRVHAKSRPNARFPYDRGVRLFAQLYLVIAEAIDRGRPPFVLSFTDTCLAGLKGMDRETIKSISNLFKKFVTGRARTFNASYRGEEVQFGFRSVYGTRYLWLSIPGRFRTLQLEEAVPLERIYPELVKMKSRPLEASARDANSWTRDQFLGFVSQLTASKRELFFHYIQKQRHALVAFLGKFKVQATAATLAVATVATISIVINARHQGNEDVGSQTLTVQNGMFLVGSEKSARTMVATVYEHGGETHQTLTLVGDKLLVRTSFPDGRLDRYVHTGAWLGPEGRRYTLDVGAGGKWMRPGVLVGERDGVFSVNVCGHVYPLQEYVRGTEPVPYLFRYAEIPAKHDCLAVAPRTCAFIEEGKGKLFDLSPAK